MIRGMRWMSRTLLAAIVIITAGMIPASPARTPIAPQDMPDADQAIGRIEVRLRKLHLVRPDLQ
jgi:hypothetical protein